MRPPLPRNSTRYRTSVIQAVQTPLGFYVLIVLVVEGGFGFLAASTVGTDRTFLLYSMVILMSLLVLTVTLVALFRPEALHGYRPTQTAMVSLPTTRRVWPVRAFLFSYTLIIFLISLTLVYIFTLFNLPPGFYPAPEVFLISHPKAVPVGGTSTVILSIYPAHSPLFCQPMTIVWEASQGALATYGPTDDILTTWTAPGLTGQVYIEAKVTDCSQKIWLARVQIPVLIRSQPQPRTTSIPE
jgi:hypothetical protein